METQKPNQNLGKAARLVQREGNKLLKQGFSCEYLTLCGSLAEKLVDSERLPSCNFTVVLICLTVYVCALSL